MPTPSELRYLALDQVRQRCFDESLSMPDVDKFAGSGNFFSRKSYRRKQPDLIAVDRAARAFGGRLRIEWGDDDASQQSPQDMRRQHLGMKGDVHFVMLAARS